MGKLQYIPSFYFYKFADALSQPYSQMNAFRSGLIDSSGNIVGNESSIDPFEYFIIKLKKIFEQLPPGVTKYKTGNLFGVMQLFSEEAKKFGLSKDDFNLLMEAELTVASGGNFGYMDLSEDMTTGSAAGSIGVPADSQNTNKGSVSGYDPKLGDMMTRSGPVNMFGAVEMFAMPSKEYKMFKASNSYPKSPTGNYIRRFGYRNSQNKIAIRDEETGEVHWLPAANKKSFAEEFFLKDLPILKEAKDIVLNRDELSDIVQNTGENRVEPSKDSAREVLNLQNQALQNAKQNSERFERQTSIKANFTSGSELSDLISSPDPSDRRLASDTMTMMSHFANRSTSNSSPYDGILLGRDTGGRISPILFDAKSARWSSQTEVTSSDFEKEFDEEDPFELWRSAIEHGGNVNFEEDPEKIAKANLAVQKVRSSPGFQTKARDLAARKILAKYPIISGSAPGKIFTPKQVTDLLRGTENLAGKTFRINTLGRSTSGVRIGQWQKALEDYEKGIRNRRPEPAKVKPSITTTSDALTKTMLANLGNDLQNAYTISPEDIMGNKELYGSEVANRFYEMVKKYGRL